MRRIRSTLLWLAVALAVPSAGARELHVATGGDDAADGSSWETAWRTPARAFGELRAGDVVSFDDGRYEWGGQVHWLGTREAPIEVRARHAGRAVFDGGARVEGWETAPGLRHTWRAPVAGDRPVLLVSEADTRRVLERVVQPHDCERTLGCWAFDDEERRLYVRTSTGLPPARHVIEAAREPWGLLIRARKGSDEPTRYLIFRGLVFKNYGNAGLRPNHAENVLIEDCTALQSGYGLELWYSSFTTVRRCEVWATFYQTYSEAAGIMFHGTARYSLAEDNYVHDSRQDGIRAYSGGSEGTRFLNNLVVNTRDPMYFKGGKALGFPDGNVVVGGRWFGATSKLAPQPGANTLVDVTAPLEHSRRDLIVEREDVAEAHFADPAHHDYRLQSDSPHRHRGRGAHPYRGEVLYVGPEGSDAAGGASVAGAWRTLARATAALRPGQTLYLLPGHYREPLVVRRSGSAEQPTTVRAWGRGRVVIETGPGEGAALSIEDAEFVTVEDLELRSADAPAAALRGAPDAVLRRIAARDSRVGVAVEASPRGRLERSLLLANAQAGLALGPGSPGWSVTDTAFARNGVTQVSVDPGSLPDTHLQANAYDVAGAGGLGRWGARPAGDLEAWRAATGQDGASVAGAIELPGADAGDFDVEPGSLLAGAGWLAATIGPGELRSEPPAPRLDDARVAWVGARAALVTWETPRREERTLAWYGRGDSLDHKITGPGGTFHSVTLADLEPDTAYRVRVGGGWRHADLPPVPEEKSPVPLRDFAQLAEPLRRLEAQGVATGISRVIEFRTRSLPPPGRVLHVARDGDDAADGLGRATAWRTLFKAAGEARPGDEVVVEPGVYEEGLVPASGGASAARRIVYRSASWQPVVLSGSERTRAWALRLRGRRHMTFQGFHFRDHEDLQQGQVMLEGMNEDIVFRHCFFDGRGGNSGGIRALYNSTNDATVEDSAFLYNWRAISWYYGSLAVRHTVFDVGIFGHVYLHRKEARLSLRDSVATSAGRAKNPYAGHLIVAESAEGVRSDHNRFYFQPYDEMRQLYEVGAHTHRKDIRQYRGPSGLERWRRDTRNGVHTRIVSSPGFAEDTARDLRDRDHPHGLDAYRLTADSPLRGAASDGGDVGIRFPDR